jgi:acyl transferase domain-containing protein
LESGADATCNVPADRWDAEALFDPDPTAPGKIYVKRGGFLEAIDGFEPEFFGISPREAVGMDPQQRLLLEVVWEALEDAGIPPDKLRGSPTGVWIGLSLDDYAVRTLGPGVLSRIDPYSALGNARSVAAGRIAYVLDLRGPVMQLDASCASSLVAAHLACQSLRTGECELAIVGGVNLMSSPEASVALCKLQALSRDGRCKTFDASADGYGRGEGCGAVVLRRLSAAQAAGDRIHAVIRGTAVNHGGRSNGLTAPNGAAQEAVIRAALANGGVQPNDIGYVETHGTGTLLGDPIEVLALSRVYGQGRGSESLVCIGSVKTNFGHLEAAAGIAGLIKAVLAISHRRFVPHLHFRTPNAKIPWRSLMVRVATEAQDWPSAGAPRMAGVSSFGISGTNAHVIVEQAPEAPVERAAPIRSAELIMLSAKTAVALRAASARLSEYVRAHSDVNLGDLAYNLVTTRAMMDERLAVVVPTREALSGVLDAVARGELPASAAVGRRRQLRGNLAWLFPGQGAQQQGMGRELCDEWPAFSEALDAATSAVDEQMDRPLRAVMWARGASSESGRLDETAYAQPAIFAYGWALSALWRSWGVEPDLVGGHSVGEITAACVAGVFTLRDAARLICARGRLMQSLPSGGAMVAIASSEREVAEAIEPYRPGLVIAAVNAPRSVVISGDEEPAIAVSEQFSARGVSTKRLRVSHAFHSARMDPMLEAFRAVAESVSYRVPALAMVSNVTGKVAGLEVATPTYWVQHVREPVHFADCVQTLRTEGCTRFLELGPRVTLLPLVAACLPRDDLLLLASACAGAPATRTLLHALGEEVANGGSVDWKGVFPTGGRRVDLPTYAWQRERYWMEGSPRTGSMGAQTKNDPPVEARVSPPDARDVGRERHSLGGLAVTGDRTPEDDALARDTVSIHANVHDVVRAEVARALRLPNAADVPADTPLGHLGFDSLMALELRSSLTRRLRGTLPATLKFNETSANELAQHLMNLGSMDRGAPDRADAKCVAQCESLNSFQAPKARLICFHDAAGSPSMFLPFAQLAAEGVEVHTISHARDASPSSGRAEQYLREAVDYVRRTSGRRFALFGHSLGGLYAWRTALELQALGSTPPMLLVVSNSLSPARMSRILSSEDMLRSCRHLFATLTEATPNLAGDFWADLLLWRAMPSRPQRPLNVPILAFHSTDDDFVDAADMRRWESFSTGPFSLTSLPGPHSYLAQEGPRQLLLEALATQLIGTYDTEEPT